jgi:hypothetical protein
MAVMAMCLPSYNHQSSQLLSVLLTRTADVLLYVHICVLRQRIYSEFCTTENCMPAVCVNSKYADAGKNSRSTEI